MPEKISCKAHVFGLVCVCYFPRKEPCWFEIFASILHGYARLLGEGRNPSLFRRRWFNMFLRTKKDSRRALCTLTTTQGLRKISGVLMPSNENLPYDMPAYLDDKKRVVTTMNKLGIYVDFVVATDLGSTQVEILNLLNSLG